MKLENKIRLQGTLATFLENSSVSQDLFTSLCGEHIGGGTTREVYDYNLKEGYVIKIEEGNTNCNIAEYLLWDEVRYLTGSMGHIKNWFAPVEWISPNGRLLVMKKTKDIPNRKKPDKVPNFLWDIKPSNFGWIGKNYVSHDYGQFYNMIHYRKGMQKVDWNNC